MALKARRPYAACEHYRQGLKQGRLSNSTLQHKGLNSVAPFSPWEAPELSPIL